MTTGDSVTTRIVIRRRAFSHRNNEWDIESGRYTLRLRSSVDDLPLTATIDL